MNLDKWYENKVNFSADENNYKDKLIGEVAKNIMPFVRGMRETVKKTYWQSPELLDDDLSPIISCINKLSDFVSENSEFKLGPFIQKR